MEDFKHVMIKCKKDEEFAFTRNVNYSCGCEFEVGENDIYSISFPDYEGVEKKQYYVVCPNCGYINLIDNKMFSLEEKNTDSEFDVYQYRKNNLKSELIYLDRVAPRRLIKRM